MSRNVTYQGIAKLDEPQKHNATTVATHAATRTVRQDEPQAFQMIHERTSCTHHDVHRLEIAGFDGPQKYKPVNDIVAIRTL